MTPQKFSTKQLGVLVFGLIVLGVLVYMFFHRENNQPVVPNTIAIAEQNSKGQQQENPSFTTTFTPLGTVEKIGQKVLSFITGVENSGKTGEVVKGTTVPFIAEVDTAAYEKAIFDIMTPEPVREAFRRHQALLVAKGIIDKSKVNPLSNTDEVTRFVYDTFVRYINDPRVSSTERANAKSALTRLPDVVAYERRRAERILRGESADRIPTHFLAFLTLSTPKAEAAWYTTSECYKDDNPESKAVGYNMIATCCNCGFEGEDYVEDCGTNSVECGEPLGCLNMTCELYENAIWNPDTLMCGCG